MPEYDPFERHLAETLRETGDTFTTDRTELVEGGARRGRTRRLRQRFAVIGGSVAGVAALGVGGALLTSPGDTPQDVGTGTTAASTPASNPASPDITEILKKLLPKGTFTVGQNSGSTVSGVFDDGKGAAALSLSVGPASSRGTDGCPDPVLVPNDACTTQRLADGSQVTVFQGYEYPDRREETKVWYADLTTPDGTHVNVTEWNSPAEKGEKITRPNPPLSPAQLTKLVSSAELRALTAGSTPGTPAPSTPPAQTGTVGKTLTSLLPKHLKVVTKSPDNDPEFAYVVVDDGKGKSYVQINVQPNMADVKDDLFGSGAETLPDGTLVATHQGPGEKGGSGVVMWTVDTLRTDGFRVVISAFNAATQQTPATRTTPALSIKELRTIALSPKWRP
ncbi:hypothetical protein [Streptomyces acidiscabies]|uniref:LigA protein n=1 Tax=Streptomyces acidiscabies TaxID=42234 RepID=A0AAP6EL02_9ACTN|nr:hypothetical protein [Streptomyces acidiscabies]MBP5937238.1 hypothetical protein [Streptomyces sp. LBUM 1476]MBZ3914707.1 hypothetical protein [Streptomyces acidiscabies]MDX2966140.1 hypothetical protein [Streptomyces acidiscabies]MDX3020621.1 hypothetical protein [Streptomyces acidiscabies]MDX3795828.1 hypothetical protein [Streptomyces acidiscabies]